jgi:uncharacterized protein
MRSHTVESSAHRVRSSRTRLRNRLSYGLTKTASRMLLIRTRIGLSPIHGNGVFACETALAGSTVWQYEPAFDRVISEEELRTMPAAFCEYINMYAYHSTDIDGRLLLPCDHARFLNHSADPNTKELPFRSVASRLIKSGDEITCDYGAFCVDWTGLN